MFNIVCRDVVSETNLTPSVKLTAPLCRTPPSLPSTHCCQHVQASIWCLKSHFKVYLPIKSGEFGPSCSLDSSAAESESGRPLASLWANMAAGKLVNGALPPPAGLEGELFSTHCDTKYCLHTMFFFFFFFFLINFSSPSSSSSSSFPSSS